MTFEATEIKSYLPCTLCSILIADIRPVQDVLLPVLLAVLLAVLLPRAKGTLRSFSNSPFH